MAMRLPNGFRESDQRDKVVDAATYMPSLGESLSAKISEGFRYTTTNLALDEGEVVQEEEKQYGTAAIYDDDMAGGIWDVDIDQHANRPAPLKKTMTVEEYSKSPYYRKGIEWQDDYSEARARILAEQYDQRKYIDEIIQRRQAIAGFGEQAVGFGASLIGNLPDPINMIPMTGAVTATSLFGRVGLAAAEGFLGTALADAIVMPELKKRGENITFSDYVNDIVAGTVLGGVIGAAGHGLAKASDALDRLAERRRAKIDEVVFDTANELNVPEIAKSVEKAPEGFEDALRMHYWKGEAPESASIRINDASARAEAEATVEGLTPEQFLEGKIASRVNITGAERVELFDALEKATSDIAEGRDVDVSEMIRNSSLYNRLPDDVKAAIDTSSFRPEQYPEVTERIQTSEAEDVAPPEIDEIRRMEEEGLLTEMDAEEFLAAESAEARVDQYEEAGLEFVSCIAGVTNG